MPSARATATSGARWFFTTLAACKAGIREPAKQLSLYQTAINQSKEQTSRRKTQYIFYLDCGPLNGEIRQKGVINGEASYFVRKGKIDFIKEYFWNIFGIFLEYFWNIFEIFLEFFWNFFGMFLEFFLEFFLFL